MFVTSGDENERFRYKGNAISTGKYNPLTFFPKGLYEQFRRVANMYFLSVAIISLFEAISPIKPYTIWSPLVLVIGLSMAKEAVEDYARHKQDHQQNVSLAERFNGESFERGASGSRGPDPATSSASSGTRASRATSCS